MLSVYDLLDTKEFQGNKPVIPERELLIATLDRAVLDYYGTNLETKELAAEWLFNDSDDDNVFTFNWICDHLGIDRMALKERIRDLDIPTCVSQAHRWLRSKVQSRDIVLDRPPCDRRAA